jgi:hypothetical protein
MPAVRTPYRAPVRACCCILLLWLFTALPATAHTLITVTLEMVAEGDELTINLSVSPLDIIACLAPRSPSTRGQLRALGPLLGPYLLSRLAVSCDGVAVGGAYGGYLPDLLQPGAAIVADEALPTKLSFVLTWKLPPSAAHLQVGLSLFSEEGLPGFCQLILESGAGHKRQIAYVELGKSWTFALHGGAEALAPLPPALSQALLPGDVAPFAPRSFPQLVGSGLGMVVGWVPLLLVALLVALHPATLRAVLLQAAVDVLAQLVGLMWTSGRGVGWPAGRRRGGRARGRQPQRAGGRAAAPAAAAARRPRPAPGLGAVRGWPRGRSRPGWRGGPAPGLRRGHRHRRTGAGRCGGGDVSLDLGQCPPPPLRGHPVQPARRPARGRVGRAPAGCAAAPSGLSLPQWRTCLGAPAGVAQGRERFHAPARRGRHRRPRP